MNIHNYLEKRAGRKNRKIPNKKERALLAGSAAAGLTSAGIETDALIRDMKGKAARKYPKYLRSASRVLPAALGLPALYSMKRRGVFEKKASFRRTPPPGNFTASTGRQSVYDYGNRSASTGQQAMPPKSAPGSRELELKRSQQAFDRKIEGMRQKNIALKAKNSPLIPKAKPSIGKKIGGFFRKLL